MYTFSKTSIFFSINLKSQQPTDTVCFYHILLNVKDCSSMCQEHLKEN